MRLSTLATALLALTLSLPEAPRAQGRAGGPAEIKLVLLIAVDQFRYDYLTRFKAGVHRRPGAVADARGDLHPGVSRSLPHRHRGRALDDAERARFRR